MSAAVLEGSHGDLSSAAAAGAGDSPACCKIARDPIGLLSTAENKPGFPSMIEGVVSFHFPLFYFDFGVGVRTQHQQLGLESSLVPFPGWSHLTP